MYYAKAADEGLSRAAYHTAHGQCTHAVELTVCAAELHVLDKIVHKALYDLDIKRRRDKDEETSINLSLPKSVTKSLNNNSHSNNSNAAKTLGVDEHDAVTDIQAFTKLLLQITTKLLEFDVNVNDDTAGDNTPGRADDTPAIAGDNTPGGADDNTPGGTALKKPLTNGKSGRVLTMLNGADKAKFKLSYTDLKPTRTKRRKSVADSITDRIANKFTFQEKKPATKQPNGTSTILSGQLIEEVENEEIDEDEKESCVIM